MKDSENKPVVSHPVTKVIKRDFASLVLTTIATQVPIVSLVQAFFEKLEKQNFSILIEELETGKKLLTQEIIEKEEFIHSCIVISNAVSQTYQYEKTRYFIRILLNAIKEGELATDKFYEFIQILDSLSGRELYILKKMKQLEDEAKERLTASSKPDEVNELNIANEIWPQLEQIAEKDCKIATNVLPGMLARLTRTGLYEPITGTYWNYDGGKGKTTALYDEFSSWLIFESQTQEM